MRRGGRHRVAWARLAAALPILGLLAACAPRLQPFGDAGSAGSTIVQSTIAQTGIAQTGIAGDRLIMSDGTALPMRRWLPAGEPMAVILALHGFNDYSNAFTQSASFWAEHGVATYAYDQRGFGATEHAGLWPGDDRLIRDLGTAAALLRDRHPGVPLHLLGESMGGAVIMAAMAGPEPPEADGIILAAPAAWGRELQGPLQSGFLWLAAHLVPWMKLSGEGLDIWPSDNIEMLRGLGLDPLVIKETRVDAIYGLVDIMDRALAAAPKIEGPALILYGSHEQVIPPEAALAMLRRLPPSPPAQASIAIYPDGYHMLLRDRQAALVRRDILAWIADRTAPLPSGADKVAAAVVAGDGEDLALAEDRARALMASRGTVADAAPGGGPATGADRGMAGSPAPAKGVWWTAQ